MDHSVIASLTEDGDSIILHFTNDNIDATMQLDKYWSYTAADFSQALDLPEDSISIKYLLLQQSTWIPKKRTNDSIESFSSLARTLPGWDQLAKHPITGKKQKLGPLIINLNDVHRWSREEIADWIETLDIVPKFRTPEEMQKPKEIIMLHKNTK